MFRKRYDLCVQPNKYRLSIACPVSPFSYAEITRGGCNTLRIYFTKLIDGMHSSPRAADFSVSFGGVGYPLQTNPFMYANQYFFDIFLVDDVFDSDPNGLVTYVPSVFPIYFQDGTVIEGFTNKIVVNNSVCVAPVTTTPWPATTSTEAIPEPFMITIDTTKAGSANNTFILPTAGSGIYDYYVDWGDGGVEQHVIVNTSQTHVYAAPGTYQISITGTFPRIYFAGAGDRRKLMTIDAWGDIVWSSMVYAFNGCSNMQGNWTDTPNLSNTISLFYMFGSCSVFNYSVSGWNTSSITTMFGMFAFCTLFNQPVNDFDTSNVLSLSYMFWNCYAFNQPLFNWDTSSCISMGNMFSGCSAFNQSVANFDTSSCTSLSYMFNGCILFNQSLASFDTSSVADFSFIVAGCTAFKQSLATFSLASATSLNGMLINCDINAPATSTNYDNTLIAWAAADVPNSLTFHGGNSKYGDLGAVARASLIADDLWTITADGGHI
jgi:hypothetical protein